MAYAWTGFVLCCLFILNWLIKAACVGALMHLNCSLVLKWVEGG